MGGKNTWEVSNISWPIRWPIMSVITTCFCSLKCLLSQHCPALRMTGQFGIPNGIFHRALIHTSPQDEICNAIKLQVSMINWSLVDHINLWSILEDFQKQKNTRGHGSMKIVDPYRTSSSKACSVCCAAADLQSPETFLVSARLRSVHSGCSC